MFGIDNEQFKSNIALIDGEREISYEELGLLAKDIVSQVGKRTLAFLLASNTVASIAAYVGFVNEKILPLLLDAKISQELLDDLIEKYHPSFIWAPTAKQEELPSYHFVYEKEGYVLLYSDEKEPYPLHEDLCMLISTSGSTGSPKMVRQTYRNIAANTASIIQYLEIDEKERAITSLPMSYVYGLSVLNTHLQSGASLVLTDQNCYSKKFWDLIHNYKVTSFAGVPFMYEMLDKLKVFKKAIPDLKTFTQAGGKLDTDLQAKLSRYCADNGKKFIVMYGASEATARMAYLPMDQALAKKGSIGIPIPGGRFELIDADGSIIEEPDKVGELVFYGDNVTPGYATCGQELIKEDENHGRLVTGDMAKRDADGFYYIAGRKKRFIKMFGNRINLDDVDTVLKKKFDTLDIVSAGEDDFLDVFIVDAALSEAIYDFVFETFGINKKRMAVYRIDEIPKNPAGKILFSKLEELKNGSSKE